MHGTGVTFGKPFVRKQYNVLAFLILLAKNVEVLTELSDDCYCDLSVPIPNGYTVALTFLVVFSALYYIWDPWPAVGMILF